MLLVGVGFNEDALGGSGERVNALFFAGGFAGVTGPRCASLDGVGSSTLTCLLGFFGADFTSGAFSVIVTAAGRGLSSVRGASFARDWVAGGAAVSLKKASNSSSVRSQAPLDISFS